MLSTLDFMEFPAELRPRMMATARATGSSRSLRGSFLDLGAAFWSDGPLGTGNLSGAVRTKCYLHDEQQAEQMERKQRGNGYPT